MIFCTACAVLLALTPPVASAELSPDATRRAGGLVDPQGEPRALRPPAWSGRPLLLAFVAIGSSTAGDGADPNRSQAVFVHSMGVQFEDRGLKTLLIAVPREPNSPDDLREPGPPRGAHGIPVAIDREAAVARELGVHGYPTTLLLDGADRVVRRWDGLALAPALASAIAEHLSAEAADGE